MLMINIDVCSNLISEGLNLITVKKDKTPNIKWGVYQKEPVKLSDFEQWVKLDSSEFTAIISGYNDIECIDIDLKVLNTVPERRDFWNEYYDLLKENIEDFEKRFVIYKTVNSGYHIIYKTKVKQGNAKLAKLRDHAEAIIETRGLGGYFIVYNENIHENVYYKDIDYITDIEREIIINISKSYNFEEKNLNIHKKIKKDTPISGLPCWTDFDAKNSVLDVVSDELSIVRQLSSQTLVKRPGAKSPHSGYVFHDTGCLYLFSTGTIYPAQELISPFKAYAYKYHNGDMSEAAKDLYNQGFGSRVKPDAIPEPIPEKEKIELKKESLTFPLDIFPDELQDYILECNRSLNGSIDYMGCALLWSVSVMLGNSFVIEVKKNWIESCNVWFALVGKAGIGKTPSINHILQPLRLKNSIEINRYQNDLQAYEDYKNLNDKDKAQVEKRKRPKKTQFIVNDITMEGLIDLHQDNKNAVGVFKDELAGWIKDMNKYNQKGSDLEHWLSSWSGKEIYLNRKTAKSSFVPRAFIPVIGGIQPGILKEQATREYKENGFLDRILFSFPDIGVDYYSENEIPESKIRWYNEFIMHLHDQVNGYVIVNDKNEIEPQKVYWTDEAKTEWIRIFNKITDLQNSDSENEYMKSMLPKQKAYIPRFALIIQVLNELSYWSIDTDYNITEESILKAEKLSNYFIEMAKKIKLDNAETGEIYKHKIKGDKENKTSYEIFKNIYEANNSVNKSKLADELDISRQMVYKYIKKYEDERKNSN